MKAIAVIGMWLLVNYALNKNRSAKLLLGSTATLVVLGLHF